MSEIQTALIAIALVLSAVFLPMAFFGGSTGVIYRQFSITIISSMVLSVVVALVLTPALTATLLRPPSKSGASRTRRARLAARLRTGFNTRFERGAASYTRGVARIVARRGWFLLLYLGLGGLLAWLFVRLPTSFLPTEDEGSALIQYTLPVGATQSRSLKVAKQIEDYLFGPEEKNVSILFTVTGFGFGGSGQNTGLGFLSLAPWSARPGPENSVAAITRRATAELGALRDAQVFALTPPPIRGLGQTTGFTLELLNSGNLSHQAFQARRDELLAAAGADAGLVAVRPSGLPDTPTL
jgi:multidrug efflux pump